MKKFAVFDIDGTLIRWQLYHVIVDRLAKAGELNADAELQLKTARRRWKNREHPEAFSQYEAELIRIFEQSLVGINPKIFDTLVKSVVAEYKDQVYTYTRDLIKNLKAAGYVLLAISGSHHELVEEIATLYEFDDWVGSQYERTATTYSGKSYVASHHKAEILQNLIKKHRLDLHDSYAVGDSKSDAPMLEMVAHPIAFNPDKNLFAIAKQHHWNVVIERKNMIYQLEQRDGVYLLAKTGTDSENKHQEL